MDFKKSSSIADGFLSSLSMILVSEIGDKTFFIACLMAMRHPKLTVYIGAISALATMTILSALLGFVVPNLLSVYVTQLLAVVLFFIFGFKILYDEVVKRRGGDDEESDDEMTEAAAALRRRDPNDSMESGSINSSTVYASAPSRRWRKVLNPVMVEAFTLTFLAEWGDRSQLATIALAAAKNPFAVTVGGVLGHAICTGGAVLGGNIIAQRVSMKTVNIIGGVLFICFALGTLFELLSGKHEIEQTHSAPPS